LTVKLKNIGFFLAYLAISTWSTAQVTHNYFTTNDPSAKVAAMGNGFTGVQGELNSMFANPAGLSNIKSADLRYEQTDGLLWESRNYSSIAAAVQATPKLALGIGRRSHDFDAIWSPPNTNELFLTNFKVTGAYELGKKFSVGLSLNYDYWSSDVGQKDRFYADFGFAKRIELKTAKHTQSIGIGISNSNFTVTRKQNSFFRNGNGKIRQILEGGISYRLVGDGQWKNLSKVQLLAQAYYSNTFNNDYDNAVGGGLELVLADILALRGGYYYRELDENLGYQSNTNSTYGLGIIAPLDKLTTVPLRVEIDYAQFPQMQIYKDIDLGMQTVFNVKVRYIMD
jgi:hypothetical protein